MILTIQEIAEAAGVSRGTVDRVINKRGKVNAEVEQKILAVAQKVGYIHKPRKKRRPFTIGVITQLRDASFMLNIDRGIEKAKEELKGKGIHLLLRESKAIDAQEQSHFIEELVEEGIDGLAIMPVDCDLIRTKINRLIDEQHIPVVTFNSDIIGTKRSCFVGMDNKQSGKTAAGLLGLLTRGRGNVLMITGYFTNLANSLRIEGFIEELQMTFPDMVMLGVQSSQDKIAMVEQIITQTLQNHITIDAIFLASAGHEGIRRAYTKWNLAKRPFIVAYDVTTSTKECMIRGDFDFLIDQGSEYQGYLAAMNVYDILYKKQHLSQNIYTDIQLKTKYNIE